jgi:hypothetical protein
MQPIHNSLLPVLIHSQINPVHALSFFEDPSYSPTPRLQLRLGVPNGPLPSRLPAKPLHVPLLFPMHSRCPVHLTHRNLITRITVRLTELLILQFSPFSCYLLFLRPICLPQHRILKHPQPCSSLNVRDQV